jgi:hypothetical protein
MPDITTDVRNLAKALGRLVDAVRKSNMSISIQDVDTLYGALKEAYEAQQYHQDWLLSERK